MEVIDKKDCKRKAVLLNEISSLEKLIERRHTWLKKPESRFKSTYKAVITDTAEMEAELKDLKNELNELKK